MILKGKKRGSVAPHREHVALPTIVLQLARIRVPHWGQANGRRGFSSTIRVLDMNWEPYPFPKLRTSPIPQTVWCGHSLRRLSTGPNHEAFLVRQRSSRPCQAEESLPLATTKWY